MATQLQTILNLVRSQHASFHPTRVTDKVLADYLSGLQRRLFTIAADIDASAVAVKCNIALVTTPGNQQGQVGAGSGGGLPGSLDGQTINIDGSNTGPSIEVNTDTAPVLVPDIVVTSATPTSVTVSGVAWTLNQFANQVVIVDFGTGSGATAPGGPNLVPPQRRIILSNTAAVGGVATLVISTGSDGEEWDDVPDTTSLIRVVALQLVADETVSFVTALPAQIMKQGYLVKIDPTGKPYIDVANPVVVAVDAGVPLPPYERVVGGAVQFTGTSGLSPLTAPLSIRVYSQRYLWGPTPTGWIEAGQFFLTGALEDWTSVLSITFDIVPIPPDFAARTDYMVLPDVARDVMVAGAALHAARRCAGVDGAPPVDVDGFKDDYNDALNLFQSAIGATIRQHPVYVREVW